MNYQVITHDIHVPGFDLNFLGYIALSGLVSYFLINILVGYFRKGSN